MLPLLLAVVVVVVLVVVVVVVVSSFLSVSSSFLSVVVFPLDLFYFRCASSSLVVWAVLLSGPLPLLLLLIFFCTMFCGYAAERGY
jgi:hypothetical protein